MGVVSAVSVDEIRARGSIRDSDVVALRRAYYADGRISEAEADVLFELNQACPVQDAAWADCFVEMLTDYVVHQAIPEGYVTAENAQWLMSRVMVDGAVASKTELELVINVLDKSRWSPESLVVFVLEQIKSSVIEGNGPLRAGRNLTPGVIAEAEVDLLRRVLYAFGGDGNIAITRREAEVLFEINDAVSESDNHPSWRDLFVKALTNCIMSASGYATPTREQVLAQEAWLDRRGDLSLGNMVGGFGRGVFEAYREQSSEERAIERLERQKIAIVTNEAVTPVEAAWLAKRIGANGRLSANEEELIAFIRAESCRIAPELEDRIVELHKAA
jgi:hypothetical protein